MSGLMLLLSESRTAMMLSQVSKRVFGCWIHRDGMGWIDRDGMGSWMVHFSVFLWFEGMGCG
jgi:hypothetical protein